MGRYLLKRLLLIVPTLFGIILINFTIVQFAPGGPVEQLIAQATFGQTSTTSGISGGGDAGSSAATNVSTVAGSYGLHPDIIADLERQFGFDKPPQGIPQHGNVFRFMREVHGATSLVIIGGSP